MEAFQVIAKRPQTEHGTPHPSPGPAVNTVVDVIDQDARTVIFDHAVDHRRVRQRTCEGLNSYCSRKDVSGLYHAIGSTPIALSGFSGCAWKNQCHQSRAKRQSALSRCSMTGMPSTVIKRFTRSGIHRYAERYQASPVVADHGKGLVAELPHKLEHGQLWWTFSISPYCRERPQADSIYRQADRDIPH
jgi:hypothetical protein